MHFFSSLLLLLSINQTHALAGGLKQRLSFNAPALRATKDRPKLILISGCPGTGKSTFGMSLALEQGILKCISTDTVRAVMRSYVPENISPPLHRSSYESSGDENDNAVKSWKETCKVLQSSVRGLVQDAIKRNVSLVLEGVSIIPSKEWIEEFEAAGGVACGVLLVVSKEDVHKSLLEKRGFLTGNKLAEEQKLENFERIRLIQDEMVKLATESGWILIEQRIDPDPLDVVNEKLTGSLNEKNQEEAESSISKQLDLDIEDVDVFVEKSILSAEINSGHE